MMLIESLELSSAFSLGLLVGSLLTEAVILVPYWRAMDASDFLRLHSTLGPNLFRYFAPLTILATVVPVITVIAMLVTATPINRLSLLSATLVLSMLAIYFAYFKGANEKFKKGSVGVDGLPAELGRWAAWHWIRVALGIGAFIASLLAIT